MDEQLPQGYRVSRDMIASSRWIVSYQGDLFFFIERTNAIGGERIKTFKTKRSAIQAIQDHVAMIATIRSKRSTAASVTRVNTSL